MVENISIENIKSYNTEATFKIAPLTLIYGPNSSGKSTLWKFLLALRESTRDYTSSRKFLNLLRADFANAKTLAFDRMKNSTFTLSFSEKAKSESTVFKFIFEHDVPEEFIENFKELTNIFNDESTLSKLSQNERDNILKGIEKLLEAKKELDESRRITPKFLRKDNQEKIKLNNLQLLQQNKTLIDFSIKELPQRQMEPRRGLMGVTQSSARKIAIIKEKDILDEIRKHYDENFSQKKNKFKFEVKVAASKALYHEERDGVYNPQRVFDLLGPNGPKDFKALDANSNFLFMPTKISKDKASWEPYFKFLQLLKEEIHKNNKERIKKGEKIEEIYKNYINQSFHEETMSLEGQYGVDEKEFPQINLTYQNTLKAMTADIDQFIEIVTEDLETFIMSGNSYIPSQTFYGGRIFRVLFNDIPDGFLDAYLGNIDEQNNVVPPTEEMNEFISKLEDFSQISLVDQIRYLYRFTSDLRDLKQSRFNSEFPLSSVGSGVYGLNRFLSSSIHSDDEFKKKIVNLLDKLGLPFEIKSRLDDNGGIILSFENKKIDSKTINKEIPLEQSGNALRSILLILGDILRSKDSIVIFEEPENKLHPKIQGNLIELIAILAVQNRNRIIIETHSEHFILRIQKLIREGKIYPHTVAINYIFLSEKGDGSKIDHMELDKKGKFINKWRHGFFAERLDEI